MNDMESEACSFDLLINPWLDVTDEERAKALHWLLVVHERSTAFIELDSLDI